MDDLAEILGGNILNSELFKSHFSDTKFYVITDEYEIVEGVSLKTGINEIPYDVCERNETVFGGLEFINFDNFINFIAENTTAVYYREVDIPDDAVIFIDEKNFKTNKANLGEKVRIDKLSVWDNEQLCMKFAKRYPDLIRFIKNKSEAVYIEAVKQDPFVLEYIDEADQTENICCAAIEQHGHLIRHVFNKTPKIYKLAVMDYPYVMDDIPYEYQTEDLCLLVVRKNGLALRFIRNRTDKIIREAIKQNACSIQFIDNPSEELCIFAVSENPAALRVIKKKTDKICMEAVKRDGLAIKHISELTYEIFLTAISNNYLAMKYLNDDEEDEDLCFTAVLINPKCVDYISDYWIRANCKLLIRNMEFGIAEYPNV